MIRLTVIVAVMSLAGCVANPYAPTGPNGHYSDVGNLVSVGVPGEWKGDLRPQTQAVVPQYLRFPKTARFDDHVSYEAYYDTTKKFTWVAVFGNVTCSSEYGQVDHNGYYVRWRLPGRPQADFGLPWRLMDVQVLDQPY
jgi:hypothetical protein